MNEIVKFSPGFEEGTRPHYKALAASFFFL